MIVIVLANVGLPETGAKATEAPVGRPEADRLTGFVMPSRSVAVTTAVALLPCSTAPSVGLTDREKSNGPTIVKVYVVDLVTSFPVPDIVIV